MGGGSGRYLQKFRSEWLKEKGLGCFRKYSDTQVSCTVCSDRYGITTITFSGKGKGSLATHIDHDKHKQALDGRDKTHKQTKLPSQDAQSKVLYISDFLSCNPLVTFL